MAIPQNKKVMREMERMGWSHNLVTENSLMPEYAWIRPDKSILYVYNLGHTEAPPRGDKTFRKDWKTSKKKVVNEMLGLA